MEAELNQLLVMSELHDCKDCGSRPKIVKRGSQYGYWYITCPNENCSIRQNTPECDKLDVAAKIWNWTHAQKSFNQKV